jgi:hypothetical protein
MGRRKRARKWESSRLYSFVRARQLDGTINDYERPRVGVYVVTAARIYGSWGRVSQRRWPNWRRGDPWPPPIEPPELDRIAKHNRSLLHYRVRDLAELRQCLARSVPVRVAVPIDTRWYSAIGGKIEDPIQSLPFLGNHAIQAVQADDKHRRIRFWNNWGNTAIFHMNILRSICRMPGCSILGRHGASACGPILASSLHLRRPLRRCLIGPLDRLGTNPRDSSADASLFRTCSVISLY